jgi:hypothetical protein
LRRKVTAALSFIVPHAENIPESGDIREEGCRIRCPSEEGISSHLFDISNTTTED